MVVAMVCAAGLAEAEPARVEVHRYRARLIAADAIATVATVGLAYPFASPIVHLVEGNPRAALESFAMRVGFPVVAAFAGYSIEHAHAPDAPYSGEGGTFIGLAVGAAIAIAVDWTVLPHVAVAPVVSSHDGATLVGIAARF